MGVRKASKTTRNSIFPSAVKARFPMGRTEGGSSATTIRAFTDSNMLAASKPGVEGSFLPQRHCRRC